LALAKTLFYHDFYTIFLLRRACLLYVAKEILWQGVFRVHHLAAFGAAAKRSWLLSSPYSFFGKFIEELFGVRLVFNFTGLVVASCIYSLPFMFGPIYAGLNSLKKSLFEASYSLGKSKLTTIFRVILPSIRSNLLTAIVVSFAHTMGEFGVVLMIGGSVAGESKVASIAIFEAVEMLDYTKAHIYALLMLIISFFVLFVVLKFKKSLKIYNR